MVASRSIANKFKYIVIVAFLGSALLAGITLFSFENFHRVFNDYRSYDVINSEVVAIEKSLLERSFLVSQYLTLPQNHLIQKIEKTNTTLQEQFLNLEKLLEDEDLQKQMDVIREVYQQEKSKLENLFVQEAERVGAQQDLIEIHRKIEYYLQPMERHSSLKQLSEVLRNVVRRVRGMPYTQLNRPAFEADLAYISQVSTLLNLGKTPQEEGAFFKFLIPLLKNFIDQARTVLALDHKAGMKFRECDLLKGSSIAQPLLDFSKKLEEKQTVLYEGWAAKTVITHHSLVFVGLFTIVSLCWLMVGLSQLFSLRR